MSKGKLPDKYRNLNTFIRSCSKVSECLENPNALIHHLLNEYEQTAVASKAWLTNPTEVIDEIKYHWNQSYTLRINENHLFRTVDVIFNEWPILGTPSIFDLIEIDFLRKHGLTSEQFEKNWNNVYNVI